MGGRNRRKRKRANKYEEYNQSLVPVGPRIHRQPEHFDVQQEIHVQNRRNNGFVRFFHVIGLHRILPCGHIARKPDVIFLVPVEEAGGRRSIQAETHEKEKHENSEVNILLIVSVFILICGFFLWSWWNSAMY